MADVHAFSVKHAQTYGVDEAILIQSLVFWIEHNQANQKQEIEGRTWTYNSYAAWALLFPYWTENQLKRILGSLVTKGVVLVRQMEKASWDRRNWYAFADETKFLGRATSSICETPSIDGLETSLIDELQTSSFEEIERSDLEGTKRSDLRGTVTDQLDDLTSSCAHAREETTANIFQTFPALPEADLKKVESLFGTQFLKAMSMSGTDYQEIKRLWSLGATAEWFLGVVEDVHRSQVNQKPRWQASSMGYYLTAAFDRYEQAKARAASTPTAPYTAPPPPPTEAEQQAASVRARREAAENHYLVVGNSDMIFNYGRQLGGAILKGNKNPERARESIAFDLEEYHQLLRSFEYDARIIMHERITKVIADVIKQNSPKLGPPQEEFLALVRFPTWEEHIAKYPRPFSERTR